jgi:hypothetical protein
MAEPASRRAPADQPAPEEARLALRHPLDFSLFRPSQTVKAYAPGNGWQQAQVVAVAPGHGVLVRLAVGSRLITIADSRNVLALEEHKAYELHRNRLKALHERRARAHREQAEARQALEAAMAAPPAAHPIDPI